LQVFREVRDQIADQVVAFLGSIGA
jgi:hypothetical protein